MTLQVEVDGHLLEFEEKVTATGGRGQDLEKSIRGSIDTAVERVRRKATAFVDKAYADTSFGEGGS